MSGSIDERVVRMQFDDGTFQNKVKGTMSALDSLKKGLNLDGAKKSLNGLKEAGGKFNLDGLKNSVEPIQARFSALSVVAIGVLAGIASQAAATGAQMAKSLTVQPIMDGFAEYELKMGSIQTILANTSRYGTGLEEVTANLDELNLYADKTIYNFGDMTKNIGLFTNAGIKIADATSMIKGFSNEAAASGTTSQGAAGAAYQLSQALSAGTIRLMDWRSLQNVGMGNKNMQNGLIEIAEAMGTFENGTATAQTASENFNGSLEQNWLSADVMSAYLKIMAGDMDAATQASLGLTDAQIAGFAKQQKMSEEAATKVRTFTQLIGTMQEGVGSSWAQTFDILLGDFNEATELFTSVNDTLGAMISATGDARNDLLSGWDELGGRAKIIEAVKSAFDALLSVFKPIGEAFSEIFPPATAQQLMDMSTNIANFTKSLILSGGEMTNLKRTAAGFFAIFSIGWQIISKFGAMILDLVGFSTEGSLGILDFTGNIGDFLVSVDQAIKSGTGLSDFFNKMGEVLKLPIAAVKEFLGWLGALAKALFSMDASPLEAFASKAGERLAALGNLGDWIIEAWGKVREFFAGLWAWMQPGLKVIGDLASQAGKAIMDGFKGMSWDGAGDLLNTGIFAAIGVGIIAFIKDVKGMFGSASGIFESISGVFGQLTDTLKSMQEQVKSKTLMNIAIAVGILTISVVALSMIDTNRLNAALAAIGIMMLQLVAVMAIMEKVTGAVGLVKMTAVAVAMGVLSVAVLILAAAVIKLSALDWNELARGLVGIGVAMGVLVTAAKLLAKDVGSLIKVGVGLAIFSVGVNLIAIAVTRMGTLDWNELGKGLSGLGVAIALLIVATNKMGNPAKLLTMGSGLLALSAALFVMSLAISKISALSWDELIRGIAGIGGAMAILAVGMKVMSSGIVGAGSLVVASVALLILASALKVLATLSWDDIGRAMVAMGGSLAILAVGLLAMSASIVGAASLIVAAAALIVLALALKLMATLSWDDIGRAMVAMGGSLAILAVGLTLMTAALPGAAALIIAAAALMLLVPSLMLLGGMSWDQIGTGLGALAATLGILALAGVALIPALPGLVGLGLAIALIGIGAMSAGIGISLFAGGLVALSSAGSAALGMIGPAIAEFAAQIPLIATQVGLGIVAIAQVIGDNAPTLIDAMVQVLLALIAAIVAIVPALIDAATILITSFVNAMVVLIPLLVDAGLKIIVGILTGIANNIKQVVEKGTDIIVAFIEGVGDAIPKLLKAGADLIIDFINGLADTIRNEGPRLQRAGANLADAIIDGMANGIANGVNTVITAARNMATSAFNAAMNALDAHSPSRKFFKLGEWSDQGLANGMINLIPLVKKSSTKVGTEAMKSMKKSLSEAPEVMSSMEMTPTIRPVLDLSQVKRDAGLIGSMVKGQSLAIDTTNSSAEYVSAQTRANQEAAMARDLRALQNESAKVQYVQNNYSPKALTQGEIYRQTKNQLSVTRGEVEKNDNQSRGR